MVATRYSALGMACLLVGMPAWANDYHAEARAYGARVDNPGADGKSYGATGTYYFGDVSTDGVPLAEAAFLGRESMVSLEGSGAGISGD